MIKIFHKLLISAFFSVSIILFSTIPIFAQDNCEVAKYHGQGYSTKITSVTENQDGSHTIVLTVEHDGCPLPGCKKMNHYSVEADPGTYSNISASVLSGNIICASINYGPNLGGVPFQGFRLNMVNGSGAAQPYTFTVTYTLTGGLQDQRTSVKASNNHLLASFTVEEFESVLVCGSIVILPYYAPPDGGKVYNSLIGAELTSLYETYIADGTYASDDIFQIVDDKVLIEVFANTGQFNALLSLLQTAPYGLILDVAEPGQNLISGLYPISNLLALNTIPTLVNYARPAFTGIVGRGIVTSQGDTSMLAYLARNGFALEGTGVKIGVLSDSYNTQPGNPAGDDVLRGDLPGTTNPYNSVPVDVLQDFPFGTRSDEGRAMLQIIHDIAPKATLAFRTGFKGAADFAQGIRDLRDAGCDIIVDDITYLSEPFMRDGIVAQAVEEVVGEGVTYFSAAGNFGSKSYQSLFNPSPPPAGITGTAHDFSGGSNDIYQNISLTEGNYTIVLQWDDGTNSANTSVDMDIYLSKADGNTLFGFNRVNAGGDAIEVLPFTVTGGDAQTNLLIIKASGTDNVYLKYVIFRGDIVVNEYFTGSSTIVGQANAENAIAVGAVLYSNTPEYGVNPPTIASFSSRGGTPVNGMVRIKPDMTAPNGVNTTVDLGGLNIDGDLFPNFFGTSAAAPHAAAVAALIVEAKAKYYDSAISPVEIRGILQNSALDMESPGFDFSSGYGFIRADEALGMLANPSPVITSINYDTTLIPGTDSILISITGKYLTSGSVIYFNGEPLESGSIVVNDSLLTGIVPAFDARYPAIQVYNPPMAGTNGTDGGLSNPLYFYTKKTIVITIDDKSKKYGEVLPEFTAVYTVEGVDGSVTLAEEGLSAEQADRVINIPFETVADALSNTGIWEIVASLSDPLNPLSGLTPSDPIDIGLLDEYYFDFESGFLTIEKMDLLVKPRDTTFTYGDSISGIEFEYIYNNDILDPLNNVVISPAVNDSIVTYLQETHATVLVNAFVARAPATALVNGEWISLDSAMLVNTSLIISEATALANATMLVNGTFISGETLYNATVLVNGFTVSGTGSGVMVPATALVNGTATVNTLDEYGNVINATMLVNSTALVNATVLVNTTTINANSNSEAIVILGDNDIQILSGEAEGQVTMRSINMVTGNTVGEHLIIPGALLSNNFNISYGLGKLTINPAIATVTADNKVIYAGDDLPAFTATFSGLVNGETDTVVNSISFTLSPVYTGSAGTYGIIPTASADNYVFNAISASLYVNPFGSSTKYIKTRLVCVEELSEPDSSGFSYIANFAYDNENALDMFIPAGEDNYLSGAANYNPVNQPELFVSGGGSFSLPFDGVNLTWLVKTYIVNGYKISSASVASSSSVRCIKSASAEQALTANTDTGELLVYPNPVMDILHISTGQYDIKAIALYDIYGKNCSSAIFTRKNPIVEINMSILKAGIYLVKINLGNRIETIRVVKL